MLSFKVLNFNSPNDSNFIFGENCFEESLPVLNEFIDRDYLYGELNPNPEKIKNIKTVENIDRNIISHKIVNIEIISLQLVVDIDILPNINGLALKSAIDYNIPILLKPRVILYDFYKLENTKIRVNKAKLITFDAFTI